MHIFLIFNDEMRLFKIIFIPQNEKIGIHLLFKSFLSADLIIQFYRIIQLKIGLWDVPQSDIII